MSSQIDWGDLQPEDSQEQSKSSIDWGDLKPIEKKKPYTAASDRGMIPGAIKALRERPSLIKDVFPKAAEQFGKSSEIASNPLTHLLSSVLGGGDESFMGDRQTPGKIVSERLGGEIPQHLKKGAQDVADIEEFILGMGLGETSAPSLFRGKMPPMGELLPGKTPVTLEGEVISKSGSGLKSLFGKPATLESGLTKPRVMDAKRPGLAIITPEKQNKLITGLNTEASQLAQKSLEKHLPIAKQIQEGVDFTGQWEKGFGQLKAMADKHNPQIDITPVSQLIRETARKYHGIPSLHSEAAKVMKDIRAFANNPQTGMKNLLKIYRSNNKKQTQIYETAHATGKQKEYVDFLADMNRAISKSFEQTLPADSAWMKQFKDLNQQFGEFKDAEKTLQSLKSILGGEPTSANLKKIISDPKAMRKLELSMGKDGASEVQQIAKDLDSAIKSIQSIPAKNWAKWHAALPLSILIPGVGKIGGLASGVYKGIDVGRRMYGYWLTKPAKRKALDNALKDIINHDFQSFQKDVKELVPSGMKPELIQRSLPEMEATDKGQIGKKILEVNPSYTAEKSLQEPTQYYRSSDITDAKGFGEIIFKYREWSKYLPEDMYNKYYHWEDKDFSELKDIKSENISPELHKILKDQPLGKKPVIGRFGEFLKTPAQKKHFKEILDLPVLRDPNLSSQASHTSAYHPEEKERLGHWISVRPDFSPHFLRSTLMHEGIHALQFVRTDKKTGKPRIEARRSPPYKSKDDYLKNLNEVYARKYEQWVDRPVNKYRTEVEKTKVAMHLLKQQKSSTKP